MGANRTGEGRVGRGITDHVYVDVDGTLLLWPTKAGSPKPIEIEALRCVLAGGSAPREHLPAVNTRLVVQLTQWYFKRVAADGVPVLVIWTMGGPPHADMARRWCNFDTRMHIMCVGKPDMMVDDGGARFLPKHPVVLPHEFNCP